MPTFEKLQQEMYIIELPVIHQGRIKLHMMMTTLLPLERIAFLLSVTELWQSVSYFWQKYLFSQAPTEQGVKFVE